ncbi:MAG: type II toxin-antitoxin system VapC family toxin [Candidatus Dormibacteraceae bacterium]
MKDKLAYLDSSAFVKLIIDEAETPSLNRYLEAWPRWTSSMLLKTEVLRTTAKFSENHTLWADNILQWVNYVQLDEGLMERAGRLTPTVLRSLDAVHLTAALSLGEALGVVVSYDKRMIDAAREWGIPVASPNATEFMDQD